MPANIDLITLLSLVVIVVAVFKLRGVLGRRSSDDEARVERKARAEQEARLARERAGADKVVSMPRRDRDETANRPVATAVATSEVDAKFLTAANGDKALQKSLLDIYAADRSFDPVSFMTGAKQAYELIVTAYAEGNRKALRDLLSRDVFERFSAAIGDRETRGEQMDQSFVGINKAELVEGEVRQGRAQVTVKFMSQLISATRDKAGQIISGDPQRITDVTDVWTFERDLSSRNPNWRLIATQAPA